MDTLEMPGLPRMPAKATHEVRLIRQRFARETSLRNGNGSMDFGAPNDGFIWLVERIAVKADAAADVEALVGGGFAAQILDGIAAGSAGFDPPLIVPERSPLVLVVSTLAGTEAVEANVQMVIAQKFTQRVESEPEMVAILREMRDCIVPREA